MAAPNIMVQHVVGHRTAADVCVDAHEFFKIDVADDKPFQLAICDAEAENVSEWVQPINMGGLIYLVVIISVGSTTTIASTDGEAINEEIKALNIHKPGRGPINTDLLTLWGGSDDGYFKFHVRKCARHIYRAAIHRQ